MSRSPLSLLTLNISRPPAPRARDLLDYLWHREEEILVLTETGLGGGSGLIDSVCRAAGYQVEASLSDAGGRRRPGLDPAALGVSVIARGAPLSRLDLGPAALLPERTLVLQVGGPPDPIRLIAVYGAASDPVRYSGSVQRQRKRDWLLAFCTWLSELPPAPTLLVGDLNIVAPGHPDALPYVLAQERTAYELITDGLGYVDLYAWAHDGGPGEDAASWVDHSGVGCRYDYALAAGFEAVIDSVGLDHTPRQSSLTDHSALAVHLHWPSARS